MGYIRSVGQPVTIVKNYDIETYLVENRNSTARTSEQPAPLFSRPS